MQRYKYETETSTDRKATELGVKPYTMGGSNMYNQLLLEEKLASQAASAGKTADTNCVPTWREDETGKALWWDPVWGREYDDGEAVQAGVGLSTGVGHEEDFLGMFDFDVGVAQAGLIAEPGTTHLGGSITFGQARITDEIGEDERMGGSFGIAAGLGYQGRVHHSDDNNNGKTEYGFGVDAGWASFDIKTEDPLLTMMTGYSGIGPMWLADELLPEDINLTEGVNDWADAAADTLLPEDPVAADLKSPVQIAKERKAKGEEPAKPAEKDYSSMLDW